MTQDESSNLSSKRCLEEAMEAITKQKKEEGRRKTRKKVPQKQEAIRARKREDARRRREEIRSDPKLYEAQKKSERERYMRRRQEGKIRLMAELSDRERYLRRKRNRESIKRSREKKKGLEVIAENIEAQIVSSTYSKKQRGQLRIDQKNSSLSEQLKAMQKEMKNLQQKVMRQEKVIQQLKTGRITQRIKVKIPDKKK